MSETLDALIAKARADAGIRLAKRRCPNCASSQILYRKRTRDFWCRQCGWEWAKLAPTPAESET